VAMSVQQPAKGGHGVKAFRNKYVMGNWMMPAQRGQWGHCAVCNDATSARAIDATSVTKAAGGQQPGQCKGKRQQHEPWRLPDVGQSAFTTRAMPCNPPPVRHGRQRHCNEGDDASDGGRQRHCNTGHGTIAMCNGDNAIATRATTPA
jgi:hypothetical protein